jgi:hypothetical protein
VAKKVAVNPWLEISSELIPDDKISLKIGELAVSQEEANKFSTPFSTLYIQ